MEKYVERMILEHKELNEKIKKLAARVVNDSIILNEFEKDSIVEYVDKKLQLDAMYSYRKHLTSRLIRAGINYDYLTNEYVEIIDINSLKNDEKTNANEN